MPVRPHRLCYPNCRCLLCAKFSAICKCNKCGEEGREFRTFPALRRHQTYKPKLKRGSKDAPRAAIVPDGQGFLERVLANKKQIQKYNLSVISRFCAALNDMRPGRTSAKFTRTHKRILDEIQRSETNTLLPLRLELPTSQATSVFKLAQSVNVSPSNTLALLVSYGLERLSSELRENSVAPPLSNPNVAKVAIQERLTAARELLEEEPKVREFIEYSVPTSRPISEVKSYFIPSSSKE
jgi:hypothetical protein